MNIWSKKFNKTNKSVYEISKELNVPEEKIKEVIKGEREVPTNEVDRVNGAFSSNSIGISSFERTMMEQFFIDNDIQKLKTNFGYKSLRDLSNAMDIGISTIYYLRGDKIKATSDKLLKKAYDFFQDDWNKKAKIKRQKKQSEKNYYYQMSYSELPNEVIDWYKNVNLKELLYEENIKVTKLMEKLGFSDSYSAIYYKYAKRTINGCTNNWLLIQQLYNYYHGLELLNTKARTEEELYGNINTPTFEYNNIEHLDVEPKFNTVGEQNNGNNINILENNKKVSTVFENASSEEDFVSIEEYNKVCEELERYKFLIDMLKKGMINN